MAGWLRSLRRIPWAPAATNRNFWMPVEMISASQGFVRVAYRVRVGLPERAPVIFHTPLVPAVPRLDTVTYTIVVSSGSTTMLDTHQPAVPAILTAVSVEIVYRYRPLLDAAQIVSWASSAAMVRPCWRGKLSPPVTVPSANWIR